jgi:soluble cytochrome b562
MNFITKAAVVILASGLFFNTAVFAADVDMEKTMKRMALSFKQAKEAQSVEQMTEALASFSGQLELARQAKVQQDKQQVFQQGFDELTTELKQAQLFLAQQDLAAAKQHLVKMDELRKKYHKHRSPSFWQLIFG